MLSYEEFKEKFKEVILEQAQEDEKERISFSTLKKVNIELDTIGICSDMGAYQGGPCLYFRDIYSSYTSGDSMQQEAAKVLETLRSARSRFFQMPTFSWDYVKKHVVLQLINRAENDSLLKEVPHRDYLDLAVIYRCILENDDSSIASCVITEGLRNKIGVTEEELFQAAYSMSPILLMPRIYSMYEMMLDTIKRLPGDKKEELEALDSLDTIPMWVISDTKKQLGSYLLLYPDIFRGIAEEKTDLYIIPSSIHELIAIPTTLGGSAEQLSESIRFVNSTEVLPEEKLSDTLYKYIAAENTIIMAEPEGAADM